MTQAQTIARKTERHAARVIDGQALVVVLDQRAMHRLNAVGTRVWELCDGRTVTAIVDDIVSEFDVTREVAEADVARFLDELAQAGMIELGAAK
jgi:GeoRSP system PqqD family protein